MRIESLTSLSLHNEPMNKVTMMIGIVVMHGSQKHGLFSHQCCVAITAIEYKIYQNQKATLSPNMESFSREIYQ